MTQSRLEYLGPSAGQAPRAKPTIWARLPIAFIIVVVVPTLLAAIYYLLIVTPRYVSEARFVVRTAQSGGPGAIGAALQGVGLAPAQVETFAVHEYATSSDSIRNLKQNYDLAKIYAPRGLDILSGYPRFGEAANADALQKAMRRYVTVGYDSTTGISTIRVQAFRSADARDLATALLESGEALVNRLNERATNDAVEAARQAQVRATERLAEAQNSMTAFRSEERFIDPATTLNPTSQVVGSLMASVAQLRAERDQIAREAPQSPQLGALDGRIAGLEKQIAGAQERMTGGAESLAPQVGAYERLVFNRELASRELASASAALLAAEQSAGQKKLYLERIVEPSLPEASSKPRRWFSILSVLVSTLFAYGLGWLIWSGVREHRQD
ncbi:chain-length determining protein [Brevundimonas sp. 357]|jgi:capsular polysaccharide transport system permease protein|uniref:chain-length determining protein n=1 Tax=Brevundimonas sp. 357 TaxID=2555782 RepID=UPI000F76889E|nr:chain-length determining protein [Brevundimonas sp. 357]RSB42197.1 chain-length determining protein [Brevundimonas sp. 357]